MATTGGAQEQQARFRLSEIESQRMRLSVEINGINVAIQAAARQRTAREREIDGLDFESSVLKREIGVPRSEWLSNERRMDELAWYRDFTWSPDGDRERCSARSPETQQQCGMVVHHPVDWGHAGFEPVQDGDGGWTRPTVITAWFAEANEAATT